MMTRNGSGHDTAANSTGSPPTQGAPPRRTVGYPTYTIADQRRMEMAIMKFRTNPMRALALLPTPGFPHQRYPLAFAVAPPVAEILSRYAQTHQEQPLSWHIIASFPNPPFTQEQHEHLRKIRRQRVEALQSVESKMAELTRTLESQPPPPNVPQINALYNRYSTLRNTFLLEVKLRSFHDFSINNLPSEVLTEIFRLALLDQPRPMMDIALTRAALSQVCRLWRNIVCTDVTLWSTIRVIDAYPWRLTQQHIDRCGASHIDIRVDDNERQRYRNLPLRGQEWQSLINLLFTKLSQIRILILSNAELDGMHYVTDKLQVAGRDIPMRMERLELHLEAPNARAPARAFEKFDSVPLFGGRDVDALSWLTLKGVPFEWNNSFVSNLTTLDIRRIPSNRCPTLSRFRELLAASPHLNSLVLDGAGPVMPIGWESTDLPPIHMPSLTTFSFGDHSLPYATFICRQLFIPNIKEMTLLNLYGDDYTPFLQTITGSTPNLRILTWYSVELHASAAANEAFRLWVNAMPKLRYLRISGVRRSMMDMFLLDAGESGSLVPKPVLANLLALEWENLDPDDMAYFLRRRRELGMPLKKLYTHYDFWQKLQAQQNASAGLANLAREGGHIQDFVPPLSERTPEELEALADDDIVMASP